MQDRGLRAAIDAGDVAAVRAILSDRSDQLSQEISWSDGRGGGGVSSPLGYVCLARFHGLADHDRMGEIARVLLQAGAPADGDPGARETPLITAVSYYEPEVVRALIEAGADLEARGFAAPGETALAHAAYFGDPAAADLLVAAGARVNSLAEAAAVGDLGSRLTADPTAQERAWALRAAAVCERVEIIDQLLAAGTGIDAVTEEGGTALHWAAWHGKVEAVRHLVARGADPAMPDSAHHSPPLGWCRHRHCELYRPSSGHEAVEQYLDGLAAVGTS